MMNLPWPVERLFEQVHCRSSIVRRMPVSIARRANPSVWSRKTRLVGYRRSRRRHANGRPRRSVARCGARWWWLAPGRHLRAPPLPRAAFGSRKFALNPRAHRTSRGSQVRHRSASRSPDKQIEICLIVVHGTCGIDDIRGYDEELYVIVQPKPDNAKPANLVRRHLHRDRRSRGS